MMIVFPKGSSAFGRLLVGHVQGVVRPRRGTWFSEMLGIDRPRPEAARRAGDRAVGRRDAAAHRPRPRCGEHATASAPVGAPVLDAKTSACVRRRARRQRREPRAATTARSSGWSARTAAARRRCSTRSRGRADRESRGRRARRCGSAGRAGIRRLERAARVPGAADLQYLTCIEDVLLSTPDRRLMGIAAGVLRAARRCSATSGPALGKRRTPPSTQVGLADLAEEPTCAASYGQRRHARARARDPRTAACADARRAVRRAQRVRDRRARGNTAAACAAPVSDPAGRPQARLHHVALRPGRRARARRARRPWAAPARCSPTSASSTPISASRKTTDVLELRGVEVSYGAGRSRRGIDLDVGSGEVLTIVGPNGAGKTSTLSAISGSRRASGHDHVRRCRNSKPGCAGRRRGAA